MQLPHKSRSAQYHCAADSEKHRTMDYCSSGLQISVVTDTSGFDALAEEWAELEASSPDSSIFMSWDCQRLWWKHYGGQRRLHILVARDSTLLVGLLPLYLDRHAFLGVFPGVRKLVQLGLGGDTSPDDMDALLRPGYESRAARALVDFLGHTLLQSRLRGRRRQVSWDVLELSDLPAGSHFVAALLDRFPHAGLRIECHAASPIISGKLPGDHATYLQTLGRHRRRILAQKRRRFESQKRARFSIVDSPQGLESGFEDLARLHRLRWSGRTEHPAFSSPEFCRFHREWMDVLQAQGRLMLPALELDGRRIAMLYCMVYKNRLSFFQSGFDPACSHLSPGDVLISHAVELAIARGCEVFDMLKGDHDYKRRFFQDERRNLEVRAFRPGVVDIGYRLFDRLRHMRRTVRARLKRHGPLAPHAQAPEIGDSAKGMSIDNGTEDSDSGHHPPP